MGSVAVHYNIIQTIVIMVKMCIFGLHGAVMLKRWIINQLSHCGMMRLHIIASTLESVLRPLENHVDIIHRYNIMYIHNLTLIHYLIRVHIALQYSIACMPFLIPQSIISHYIYLQFEIESNLKADNDR